MRRTESLTIDQLLDTLRTRHRAVVRRWFDDLQIGELDGGVLEIRAKNPAQRRYLADWCARPFADAAMVCTGRLVTVQFTTPGADPLPPPAPEEADTSAFDVDDTVRTLNPDYVFEQFIVGPCNRMGHAACTAVSNEPGRAYNPLFIHGDVGLGKTHLLQAVCHALLDRDEPLKILFLTCETFTNHFLESVERGLLQQFRYRYRHADVLVIDDIQFLAKRERSQEEFFHTFNTLYQAQKQIILSADCPPRDIPSLENRLVSRFNSGLVMRLDPPCFETRLAIIRKKAQMRGLSLPDDVAEWIALRINSNIRELEGAITQVHAYSTDLNGAIRLETAQDALKSFDDHHKPTPTMQEIMEAVIAHYKVKLTDLQSRRRNRTIAVPRQVCMHLGRELTSLSLEEIGGYVGGRDHSTVIHAHKTIRELETRDAEIARALTLIKEQLTLAANRAHAGVRTQPVA